MANIVVVGTQWGDEGKGKIVDLLTERSDLIIRFQGGNNAGHTLVVGDRKVVLHLIPSGILHPGKLCVIGSGVVLDPEILLEEIDALKEKGYDISPESIAISDRTHVIMPYHRIIDTARDCTQGIGTTGRGIGPAYEDKARRLGIRVVDLANETYLKKKLDAAFEEKQEYITRILKLKPLDKDSIFKKLSAMGARIRPYVRDVPVLLDENMKQGRHLLFEGAQGANLDMDHGTYPYVTSSNTVAGQACVGSGIGPTAIHSVIGICKAYTTRVGWPLPDRTQRRDRRKAPCLRRRIRGHHRQTPALRLAGPGGAAALHTPERHLIPRHHETRRALGVRDHQGGGRIPVRRLDHREHAREPRDVHGPSARL